MNQAGLFAKQTFLRFAFGTGLRKHGGGQMRTRPLPQRPEAAAAPVAETSGQPTEPSARPAASPPALAFPRLSPVLLGLLAAGVVLRILATQGELWLDEIWSLALVQQAKSPFDVLTQIHHDNNHYLNSIWLWMWSGQTQSPIVLRGLSLVFGAGTLSLVLFGRLLRGRRERVMGGLLFGLSFALMVYDSEARGYSGAVFFALLCYGLFTEILDGAPARKEVWFALGTVAGLLCHLTFALVWVGFLAMGVAELARHRRKELAVSLVKSLAPAGVFVLLLWAVDLRYLRIGGGDEAKLGQVISEAILATYNLPAYWPRAAAFGLLLLVVGWGAKPALAGRARPLIFFGFAFCAPALVFVIRPPLVLAPRYFLIAAAFLLLMTARMLAAWLRAKGAWRIGAYACLGLFVLAGVGQIRSFLRDGRGHYAAGARYLLEHSTETPLVFGADMPFRHFVMLDFYMGNASRQRSIQVFDKDGLEQRARWILTHDVSIPPAPAPKKITASGHAYSWVASYPYSRLSGWNWHIYAPDE